MPAPEVSAFGDGDHEIGESGLAIDGGGFGGFPGAAWVYENANRTGATDQLTISAWNDIQLTGVDIPASPNNVAGTRYLFVQREDLAWSQAFSFTLSGMGGGGGGNGVGGDLVSNLVQLLVSDTAKNLESSA